MGYNEYAPMTQRWVKSNSGAQLPTAFPPAWTRMQCLPCLRCPARTHSSPSTHTYRYHYNVSNHRLDVHVSKGFEDGLYISSVCACGDLWAIIMDAGTGFSQQVGAPAGLAGGQARG